MKVNEDLSILFWLKRQKATKEGLVPIYVRITVKGGRTEFSSGKKIHPDHWDEESASATSGCPDYKLINSYIGYFGETDHPIPWQIDHLNCWRTDAANAVEAFTKIVI